MCFTVAGRLQTRLAALLGPLLVTLCVTLWTGQYEYWTLFGLMAGVGLLLDIGGYSWLLGFQPRWLSVLLAAGEFWVIKQVAELPYPWSLVLDTRQAVEIYVPGWLLSWLILQAVLPLLWPRWAEDGGEIRPVRWQGPAIERLGSLDQRRKRYGVALVVLAIAALPWIVGAARTPAGQHFTGLLCCDVPYLAALREATAVTQGAPPDSIAGLLGTIALLGRWPVLHVYLAVWAIVAFGW